MHHTTKKLVNSSRISQEIRMSFKKKKSLHICSRNCPLIKNVQKSVPYYFMEIIRKITKYNYYNSLLMIAENKFKTTLNILNDKIG
jgi:hypothetical protein